MRPLAIVAAIVTVISFLFWLSGWIFWNFLAREFAPGSASSVMQVLSTAASLLEYLAVILVCIALFFGGKKETAN